MDKKHTELEEQEAPLKNTDNAYVQVGEDGNPVIPENEPSEKTETSEKEKGGTTLHR
jgi:hypothetical protein